MLRKPIKKLYYISAIPRGNVRHLTKAGLLDVYTGQLALDWMQITREDIQSYMPYYRRKNSPAMISALPSYSEKVLSSYIRYYIASLNHGKAIPGAPRRFGEESQSATLENVPFMKIFSSEEVVPVEKDLTLEELQRINAIVRDNSELAANLGLSLSGNNRGPIVDVAKARAAIAASPDAMYFQEGVLPMGNVPEFTQTSERASNAMGSAFVPASTSSSISVPAPVPVPGLLSRLFNIGSAAPAPAPASRGRGAVGRKRAAPSSEAAAESIENASLQLTLNSSGSRSRQRIGNNQGALERLASPLGNGSAASANGSAGAAFGGRRRRRTLHRKSRRHIKQKTHRRRRNHSNRRC